MYGAEARTAIKNGKNISNPKYYIIRGILQIPQSTPNDAITMEKGTMDLKTLTDLKQINNHMRISKIEQGRQIKITWSNSKKWGIQINNVKEK